MEVDLHVHTKYSFDCTMKPKKIVEVAKRAGLNAIAVTDHNKIQGAYETQKYATDGFVVIVGEEVATKIGDIIALFITEEIKSDDPIEVITRIKQQGGLAILAHPLVRYRRISKDILKLLDGLESFNARHASTRTPQTPGGEKDIVEFAQKHNLILTAGSDAHFYHEIGKVRTILPGETLEDIKLSLKQKFVTMTGRRSSPLNQVATSIYKFSKLFFNPVPEES